MRLQEWERWVTLTGVIVMMGGILVTFYTRKNKKAFWMALGGFALLLALLSHLLLKAHTG